MIFKCNDIYMYIKITLKWENKVYKKMKKQNFAHVPTKNYN